MAQVDSPNIPGTVRLVDLDGQTSSRHDATQGDVVLVPRPSSSPDDPLNWSRKRKIMVVTMAYVYTLGTGIPTSLQYSVLPDITKDTGISTQALVQGTGVMFLFFGWACLFWQPIALTYGRRGVYLISLLLTVPLMVWTAYSKSAGEWYAHRLLIGIAASPIESLPEVTVFDLFFAHNRGTYMALYICILFGSNFLAPLVAGWFNDAYGWRWTMHFGAIIAAVAFVILFFFMEETMYFRSTTEGAPASNTPSPTTTMPDPELKLNPDTPLSSTPTPSHTPSIETTTPKPQSQSQSLWHRYAPFRILPNRPSNLQMLRMMYRPVLMIFQFPCTAWAGFLYGINLSWYNVLNGTTSPILSASPYNWSAALIGCVYTGPIIGSILACLWSGTVADKFTLYLARRNNGIREAEHRLWPLAVSGILSAAGLITWGVGAYHNTHWVGLVFGLGLMTFGCVTGGTMAVSYNVDCFKEISGETTVSVMIIRNTIGFGFSYAITPWYTDMGLQDCFVTAAGVSVVCTFSFLGMMVFGKRLRGWAAPRGYEILREGGIH